jgi:hypothetical protein
VNFGDVRRHESEHIQKPENDGDDYNGIQNRLDRSCHRNESIDQLKYYANDDEKKDHID